MSPFSLIGAARDVQLAARALMARPSAVHLLWMS